MIQVIVGLNTRREPAKIYDETTTTPRMVLDDSGIDYAAGNLSLDASPLRHGEIDKTFAELGKTDGTSYLMCIVKGDNAA